LKFEFGNIEHIRRVKEDVERKNMGRAFDHLYLALCEIENYTENENQLFNLMDNICCTDDFGLTDGYSETKS